MALTASILEAGEFLKAAVSPVLHAENQPELRSSSREAKSLILNAADSLLLEVTKMAVLFSGQGQPSDTDAAAILRTFQQRFAAVCAVLHSVVGGAGPTMQSAVNGAVNGLLCSCQAFLDDLKTEEGSTQLPQRVGVIRERCEAVKQIPLNNAVALGRKLTLCARQIKDAHREVKELVATERARSGASLPEDLPAVTGTGLPGSEELYREHSSTAEEPSPADGSSSPSGRDAHTGGDSNAHAGDSSTAAAAKTASEQLPSAGGALGADSMGTHGGQAHASEEEGSRGGFEEYETDELSPLERDVAAAAEAVIGQVVEILNIVIRILLRGAVPVGEELESWESVGFHCKNLETTANDLVAELYGPQDAEEVSSACQAVATGTELILEELPSSVLEQHGSELAEIDRIFTAAQEALEQKVEHFLQAQKEHNLSSEE